MADFYDIDKSRSYATRERLEKALKEMGFDDYRYTIVCNTQGRFTAIFPAREAERNGYLGIFAQKGFLTLG